MAGGEPPELHQVRPRLIQQEASGLPQVSEQVHRPSGESPQEEGAHPEQPGPEDHAEPPEGAPGASADLCQ